MGGGPLYCVMRPWSFLWLPRWAVLPAVTAAQTLMPVVMTPLATSLNETSGPLSANGAVLTQLDSGNPARLYQLDTLTGNVLREVVIANVSNADWEDIDTDGDWAFVGDIGNNSGDRTDLRIFRWPRC